MKKYLSIILIVLIIFSLIGCSVSNEKRTDNDKTDISSENSTLSDENYYIETYSSNNNVIIAKVETINVKKSLIEAMKNQSGIDKSNVTEETIELVAVDQYVKNNNINIDKSGYDTFYESNLGVSNSISNEALLKMNLSRDDFLKELNYLTDIIISKSAFNRYVFQHVINGDLTIDNEDLNEQYINCVDEQKKFHNQEISYAECYSNYQNFFDNYCKYITEQSNVTYYQ